MPDKPDARQQALTPVRRRVGGFLAMTLVAWALLACSPFPERYSCSEEGRAALAALQRAAAEFDSNGEALGYDDCDSSGAANVSAYTDGVSVAESFAAVRRVLACSGVDADKLRDLSEILCSHEGLPVLVSFDISPATESVNVTLEPLDPDDSN